MNIIIFLAILVLLIIVHELGHFIVAKRARVGVDEFAVGFPPRIWGVRKGETLYALGALPIGGYVKIRGEDGGSHDDPRSLASKPRLVQAAVLLGGVTMNALLGWALISGGLMLGLPISDSALPEGYQLNNPATIITSVSADSPAARAGVNSGDTVLAINTLENPTIENVKSIVERSPGGVEFTLLSDGISRTVVVTPEKSGGEQRVGVSLDRIGTLQLSIPNAVISGLSMTVSLVWATLSALVEIIRSLFAGAPALEALTGPVGLVGLVGTARGLGFIYLISLTAIISVNLAVVNLLPFPALDGGRLLVLAIESMLRRPLPAPLTGALHFAGFIVLIALMLLITVRDIYNLY